MFINIQKFIDDVPKELEIVNLGSTFAWHDFDYKDFPKKGFNFALIPQPLSYDLKILKQYHRHIRENGVVLITLVLFSFYVDDYQDDNTNTKYYYFLDHEYINNYSKKKYWIIRNLPLLRNIMFIKKIIRDEPLLNNEGMNTKENIEKTAIQRIKGWCNQFNLSDIDVYRINSKLEGITEKTINTLQEIIDYCVKNNLKPVIVVTPVYKQYSGLVSDDILKNYLYDNIAKVNITNIPILNYFNDDRFSDYSLYMNSDCLNAKGRELLSRIIQDDLIRVDVLEMNDSGVN
jgi:hypothetical protein